jgi:hypothetical protein
MSCAKGRRCSEEDGGSGDELRRPEQPTPTSVRTVTGGGGERAGSAAVGETREWRSERARTGESRRG